VVDVTIDKFATAEGGVESEERSEKTAKFAKLVSPPMDVKLPPVYNLEADGDTSIAKMGASTLGSKLVTVPVADVVKAARRLRVVLPFTIVKPPPTYKISPFGESCRESGLLFRFGSKLVTVLVADVINAARRLRGILPFTVVNPPPTYSVVPSDESVIAVTDSMPGSNSVTVPVAVVENAARPFLIAFPSFTVPKSPRA
jgi:hypothetical protein